ncbi:MAG: cyclase family protein [Bacteroidia bacterium]
MDTARIQDLEFDLSSPVDITIPLRQENNPNAFYLPKPKFEAAVAGSFVGDVNRGGSCNVNNICLSPHGNGTHTECAGHISNERHFIKDALRQFHFVALLLSVEPAEAGPDKMVTLGAVQQTWNRLNPVATPAALVLRTLPNSEEKKQRVWSGSNPPHLEPDLVHWLNKQSIRHLLLDLPSVDREDDPNLSGHHIFFGYPQQPDLHKTITEMIYVPDSATDGLYLLNLQVLALESDASPSHPVLFPFINQ